ncbi:MAG: CoA pyrophosphatase [Bacteroidales bacterium]|nr:CoA pyrophosphatase [Bacteroidales bacterium]
MNPALNKAKLKELLREELPGQPAQLTMAPVSRISYSENENCKNAAVMLLLYPDQQVIRTVFIKRNEYDGPHSGQVSFPGGMYEEPDEDLARTAIRETSEETGIPEPSIELLGLLTPLYIPVSGICVHPYIGWAENPLFNPDRNEVQYLICPVIADLFDPSNRKTGIFNRRGSRIKTPYFDIEGEMIWGATAMILNEFKVLIDC